MPEWRWRRAGVPTKALLFQKHAHTFASLVDVNPLEPSTRLRIRSANFDEKFPVHQKRKRKNFHPRLHEAKTRTKKTCTNCFEMKTVSDRSLGLESPLQLFAIGIPTEGWQFKCSVIEA